MADAGGPEPRLASAARRRRADGRLRRRGGVRDVSLTVGTGEIVAVARPERRGEDDAAPHDRRCAEAADGSVTFDGRLARGHGRRRPWFAAGWRSSPRAGTCSPSSRWTENLTIGGDRAQAIARHAATDAERWLTRFPILGRTIETASGHAVGRRAAAARDRAGADVATTDAPARRAVARAWRRSSSTASSS